MDSAIKTISSLFALSAFGIAVVAGIAAGNSASAILANALFCMVLCRILGGLIGIAAARVTASEIATFHAANPIPDVNAALSNSSEDPVAPSAEPNVSTKSSQST